VQLRLARQLSQGGGHVVGQAELVRASSMAWRAALARPFRRSSWGTMARSSVIVRRSSSMAGGLALADPSATAAHPNPCSLLKRVGPHNRCAGRRCAFRERDISHSCCG
jgi:hypothetical protein